MIKDWSGFRFGSKGTGLWTGLDNFSFGEHKQTKGMYWTEHYLSAKRNVQDRNDLTAQRNVQDRTLLYCSKECTGRKIFTCSKEWTEWKSKLQFYISNGYVKRLRTDRETNGSKQILEVH